MGKGSGGGGGSRNSGGAGGRSASKPGGKPGGGKPRPGQMTTAKWVRLALGALIFVDTITEGGVERAAGKAAAQAAAYTARNVTGPMRDRVRNWAIRRAATAAARASGAIDTEGIGIAAARGALTGTVAKVSKSAADKGAWRSIPDNSVIGFKNGTKFIGKDVKSLIRDGISAAQKAGAGGTYEARAEAVQRGVRKAIPGVTRKPKV